MSDIFDALIIETYPQLMALCVLTAIIATLLRLVVVRTKRLSGDSAQGSSVAPKTAKRAQPTITLARPRSDDQRSATGMDFDKLATVISEANDRAGHIADTQSAAAIKLDAAEMAVIRLIAEIDGVMTLPGKPKRPAPSVHVTPHLVPAAPRAVPLPIRTDLAA